MQNIIVDRPYGFVPPHRGTWWPAFIRYFDFQGVWLRKAEGVVDYECRHVERLRESLRAERGILLAPNHCRNGDPIVMGFGPASMEWGDTGSITIHRLGARRP